MNKDLNQLNICRLTPEEIEKTCLKSQKVITWIGFLIVISMLSYFVYNRFGEMEYESYLNSHYRQTKVVFGSTVFIGSPNILVVNNESIFKVAVYKHGVLEEKLLINLIIFDASGRVVAEIKNDHWVINANNYFRLIASKNEIRVFNQLCVFRQHPDTHYGSIRTA